MKRKTPAQIKQKKPRTAAGPLPKWRAQLPAHIASIPAYIPGKPIEEVEREYGIAGAIKLASNENPMGPSPRALKAIQRAATGLHRYPDGSGKSLITRLSKKLGLSPSRILLGNGSDEIIGLLTRAFLASGDEALMPRPAFLMYEIMVRSAGAFPMEIPLKNHETDLDAMGKHVNSRTKIIFLNNPHNPTGSYITQDAFERFYARLPEGVMVVMDEAYIEFVRAPDCLDSLTFAGLKHPVVTLRTFSKAYGLAGLRIGYGIMPSEVAEILNRIRAPFNTNSLAQIGAAAALEDASFVKKTVSLVHREIGYLRNSIAKLGLTVFPSQANYLLIDIKQDADAFFKRLLHKGVIVRSMTSYGYPEYIRVSVGLRPENIRFIEVLAECL